MLNGYKNVVGLFAILTLALLLAGCGGSGQNNEGNSGTPGATPNAQPAASAASTLTGDAARGNPLYVQSCSACHGPDATGIQGLGKDLVNSEFAKNLSDAELHDYVVKGRGVDDPLNTTGIPMPPKGGNPALTDQQIMDIIAYLRTLEK